MFFKVYFQFTFHGSLVLTKYGSHLIIESSRSSSICIFYSLTLNMFFSFLGIHQASRDLYERLVEEEVMRGWGVVEAVMEKTR